MPTAQMMLASATLGTAPHTWQFTAHGTTGMAYKAMLTAGKVLALAAIRLTEDPKLLEKARAEWMVRPAEFTFVRFRKRSDRD